MAPIAGPTLEGCDGEHKHAVRLVHVEHGIRERFLEVPPHGAGAGYATEERGRVADLGNEGMDRMVVPAAERLAFLPVVRERLQKFCVGFRMVLPVF